jgi:TPR repeat protein
MAADIPADAVRCRDADAAYNSAIIYLNRVPRNPDQAIALLSGAAIAGHTKAQISPGNPRITARGSGQSLTRIVLPTALPGLAATAILCFVFSWNDFFFALIVTHSDAMTAPGAVVKFMNYEGWEWGCIAAGGMMVMLPVFVFSLVSRFLISGLTAGAIKGLPSNPTGSAYRTAYRC